MDFCAYEQSKERDTKRLDPSLSMLKGSGRNQDEIKKNLDKQLKASTLTIKQAQDLLKENVQVVSEDKICHLLEECQNYEDILQTAATHAVEIGELEKFQQLCKTLDTLRCIVNQLLSKKKNLRTGHGKKNVAFKKDTKIKQFHEKKQHANASEPYLFVDFDCNKPNVNDSLISLTQQSNQSHLFEECFDSTQPRSPQVVDVQTENKSEMLQSIPLYKSVTNDTSSEYPLVPFPESHRIQLRNTSQNTLQTFHESEPYENVLSCDTQKDEICYKSELQTKPHACAMQKHSTDQHSEGKEVQSLELQKDLFYPRQDKERLEKMIQAHASQIVTLQENVLIQTEKSNNLQQKYQEIEKELNHAKEMWLKESSRAITCYDLYKETEQKLFEKEQEYINLSNCYKDALNKIHLLQSLLRKDPIQTFHSSLKELHTIKLPTPSDLTLSAEKLPSYDVQSLEKNKIGKIPYFPDSNVCNSQKLFENNSVPWMAPTLLNIRKTFSSEKDVAFQQMNKEEHGLLLKVGLSLFLSKGVLYQDDTLQIHFSVVVKAQEGFFMLHYKNCLYGNLESFRVVHDNYFSTQHPLVFYPTPLPDELESKNEMSQRIDFVCSKPYDTFPFVTLCFLLPDTTPRSLRLPLPLSITRFMKGHYLDKETFTEYWHNQNFILHEILHSEILYGSYLSILRIIENNVALEYLQHVQDHVNTFVFCGKLTFNTNPLKSSTPLALVQYQGHYQNQTNLAYMSIRSNSIILCRALRLVFKILLGDPTRTLLN